MPRSYAIRTYSSDTWHAEDVTTSKRAFQVTTTATEYETQRTLGVVPPASSQAFTTTRAHSASRQEYTLARGRSQVETHIVLPTLGAILPPANNRDSFLCVRLGVCLPVSVCYPAAGSLDGAV